MAWFDKPAPVERSAAERGVLAEALRCDACKSVGFGEAFESLRREGQDLLVCVDPVSCRRRAEQDGLYKTVTP